MQQYEALLQSRGGWRFTNGMFGGPAAGSAVDGGGNLTCLVRFSGSNLIRTAAKAFRKSSDAAMASLRKPSTACCDCASEYIGSVANTSWTSSAAFAPRYSAVDVQNGRSAGSMHAFTGRCFARLGAMMPRLHHSCMHDDANVSPDCRDALERAEVHSVMRALPACAYVFHAVLSNEFILRNG